jgi:hypothetical protein
VRMGEAPDEPAGPNGDRPARVRVTAHGTLPASALGALLSSGERRPVGGSSPRRLLGRRRRLVIRTMLVVLVAASISTAVSLFIPGSIAGIPLGWLLALALLLTVMIVGAGRFVRASERLDEQLASRELRQDE